MRTTLRRNLLQFFIGLVRSIIPVGGGRSSDRSRGSRASRAPFSASRRKAPASRTCRAKALQRQVTHRLSGLRFQVSPFQHFSISASQDFSVSAFPQNPLANYSPFAYNAQHEKGTDQLSLAPGFGSINTIRPHHTLCTMNKLTALPVWQQYALGFAYIFPWVAFGILATDVLPESWRFQTWPESIRGICVALFVVFIIADTVFAFWYLFFRSHDDTTA
jgi:hypothetical protein